MIRSLCWLLFLDNITPNNQKLEKSIDIKLQKIDSKNVVSLDLATKAQNIGGTYPILYQMAYDICAESIYKGKTKNKNLFFKVFEDILNDKSFYSKNINIQTIFALYEKLKEKIETEHLKKTKEENPEKEKKSKK